MSPTLHTLANGLAAASYQVHRNLRRLDAATVKDTKDEVMSVPETFSSFDKCMTKSYCKYPFIAICIVGGIIFISVTWCLFRCLLCGARCCCCTSCCGSGRRNRRRHSTSSNKPVLLATVPPAYTPQPMYSPQPQQHIPPPASNAPQYAQFDVSSNKQSDALPAMPAWEQQQTVHVEEQVIGTITPAKPKSNPNEVWITENEVDDEKHNPYAQPPPTQQAMGGQRRNPSPGPRFNGGPNQGYAGGGQDQGQFAGRGPNPGQFMNGPQGMGAMGGMGGRPQQGMGQPRGPVGPMGPNGPNAGAYGQQQRGPMGPMGPNGPNGPGFNGSPRMGPQNGGYRDITGGNGMAMDGPGGYPNQGPNRQPTFPQNQNDMYGQNQGPLNRQPSFPRQPNQAPYPAQTPYADMPGLPSPGGYDGGHSPGGYGNAPSPGGYGNAPSGNFNNAPPRQGTPQGYQNLNSAPPRQASPAMQGFDFGIPRSESPAVQQPQRVMSPPGRAYGNDAYVGQRGPNSPVSPPFAREPLSPAGRSESLKKKKVEEWEIGLV